MSFKERNHFVIGKLFLYLQLHLLHFLPSIISAHFYVKSNSRLIIVSSSDSLVENEKTAITFPAFAHKDLKRWIRPERIFWLRVPLFLHKSLQNKEEVFQTQFQIFHLESLPEKNGASCQLHICRSSEQTQIFSLISWQKSPPAVTWHILLTGN